MYSHRKSLTALLIVLTVLLTLLSGTVSVGAQSEAPNATIISPEVAPDGTVTFRYVGTADVTRVQIYGEWSKPTGDFFCSPWPTPDMVLDANGVWTYSIQLEPNYYNYRFYVWRGPTTANRVQIHDPLNPPWDPTGINSQVFVPGPGVEWVGPQDVPHGQLQVVWYHSEQAGVDRRMSVYTPPDYDKNNRIYPSLYLSHGAMGNDVDWSTQGAANNILDNLIAAKKIRPMVVVMTNFNGIPGGTPGYRMDLLNSMVPAIEQQFRVNLNPEQRAFAGLSAGGGRANDILFNAPDAFGFFGLWSMAGTAPALDSPLWQNPDLYNNRGIHIGCGYSDGLITRSYDLMSKLDTVGIPYYTNFMDGCHTWFVWRDNLYDFLTTILFKIN